jgi:hypothetical protein
MIFAMFPDPAAHPRLRPRPWLAAMVTVLLAWTILAIGFHRHAEAGPSHPCEVCAATYTQAASVGDAPDVTAPLGPVEAVSTLPEPAPRAFAQIFYSNRAPPLA